VLYVVLITNIILIPDAALSNRLHNREWNVFTARYELNVQFGEIFKLFIVHDRLIIHDKRLMFGLGYE
jgi:hypothetical protein